MGKPAPIIYEEALCMLGVLGVPGRQVVAIGDSLEHDIAGGPAAWLAARGALGDAPGGIRWLAARGVLLGAPGGIRWLGPREILGGIFGSSCWLLAGRSWGHSLVAGP
jgi:hypothetical protein